MFYITTNFRRVITRQRYLIMIVLLFLFNSCSRSYIVNSVNTPLLHNKGEGQASIIIKPTDLYPTIEPQLAYAISDKIGVLYSGSHTLIHNDNKDREYYQKYNFAEIGVGYYKKFAPLYQYEVYGGYGVGNIKERYQEGNDSNFIITNFAGYSRYFIQPTIAYLGKSSNIAFTTKINYVDYRSISTFSRDSFVVEPVLSFQFGRKFLFLTQIGGSFFVNNYNYNYTPFIMSFGIKYRFGIKEH